MITIDSIISGIKEMPMLSAVATRLLQIAGDDNHSIQDIVKIVENDTFLTTRVLRVVNSAAFSPIEPINTMDKAILLLGEKMIMGIAIGSCSAMVFKKALDGYEAAAGSLWEHSLRTALASREVAFFAKKEVSANLAFTAGLLHDIGKSVISEFLKGSTAKMVAMCDEGKAQDFLEAEQKMTGTDHTEVGYQLACHWRIPETIAMTIKYHHHPERAEEAYRDLVYIVHIGDVLSMMGGVGTGADCLSYKINEKYTCNFYSLNQDLSRY